MGGVIPKERSVVLLSKMAAVVPFQCPGTVKYCSDLVYTLASLCDINELDVN